MFKNIVIFKNAVSKGCCKESKLICHCPAHIMAFLLLSYSMMLERLCHCLYDVFRPLIIHINHLETLAELCSILKIEMLEEHVQNNGKDITLAWCIKLTNWYLGG